MSRWGVIMTSVALDIAQKELPDLIENVKLGGHVVITKDKTPVAELVPVTGSKVSPIFGSAKGMIKISEDFDIPLSDFDEYVE